MTINQNHIPIPFLTYSSDILADTNNGLSGTDVVKALSAYAVEYQVHIPHAQYPFEASNKRTALYENIKAFTPPIQFKIIRELCEHRKFANGDNQEVKAVSYTHLDVYKRQVYCRGAHFYQGGRKNTQA